MADSCVKLQQSGRGRGQGLMPWTPEAAGEQPVAPADVPEGIQLAVQTMVNQKHIVYCTYFGLIRSFFIVMEILLELISPTLGGVLYTLNVCSGGIGFLTPKSLNGHNSTHHSPPNRQHINKYIQSGGY